MSITVCRRSAQACSLSAALEGTSADGTESTSTASSSACGSGLSVLLSAYYVRWRAPPALRRPCLRASRRSRYAGLCSVALDSDIERVAAARRTRFDARGLRVDSDLVETSEPWYLH